MTRQHTNNPIKYNNKNENGIANVDYEIETNDGERHTGQTDSSGKTSNLSGYTTADCRVSFLNN